MGPFTVRLNLPGEAIPGHNDHGYGPLAVIGESFLEPGTFIRMHEHRNDEIISYVPQGIMRHEDPAVGNLVTDPDHLMVMNAGWSFWHEERTLPDDPHLRMLQIFIRPHTIDLEPRIQHGPLTAPEPNTWRYLSGPEGSDAPFTVRNDVCFYDLRLDEGAATCMPEVAGWDTYFYVFTGKVEVNGAHFAEAESGLMTKAGGVIVRATRPSLVVAFLINPDAEATREGTIGR